jgi:hypothetical protein
MNIVENIQKLWNYLVDEFGIEELEAGFSETIEGFEFSIEKMEPKEIENLSTDEAKDLLFDIGYMALNYLFGGDWGTWYDVLKYSLEFDEDTIKLLEF